MWKISVNLLKKKSPQLNVWFIKWMTFTSHRLLKFFSNTIFKTWSIFNTKVHFHVEQNRTKLTRTTSHYFHHSFPAAYILIIISSFYLLLKQVQALKPLDTQFSIWLADNTFWKLSQKGMFFSSNMDVKWNHVPRSN